MGILFQHLGTGFLQPHVFNSCTVSSHACACYVHSEDTLLTARSFSQEGERVKRHDERFRVSVLDSEDPQAQEFLNLFNGGVELTAQALPGPPHGCSWRAMNTRDRLLKWMPAASARLGSVLACLLLAIFGAQVAYAQSPPPSPSPDVQAHLKWLLQTRDHQGQTVAVVDKRQARLWLFSGELQTLYSTPVLLGSARGDDSVPGIGERDMRDIKPFERTTPAGRFIAEAGENAAGEDIFWIDYDAAVSMHRVRANNPAERRLQRLASATAGDNRISYGCINVPTDFYDRRLRPLLSASPAVVYVLPETRSLQSLFGSPAVASQP